MAYKKGDAQPVYPQNDTDTIQIIRREVVGEVHLSPNGTENPLVAAFKIAAEYLGENAQADGGLALEFDLWDRTWRASGDMPKPLPQPESDPYSR